MRFIDFHSHHPSLAGELVLQQDVHTWGIHPWRAAESSAIVLPSPSSWLAIGECGLDRLCNTPWEVQLRVFRAQVALSEQNRLPLILHCVKAHAELLAIQRQMRTTCPWIHHGFRGKPTQLRQLLAHGWYFSFGIHFAEASVMACPLDRLLVETDDSSVPVSEVYAHIAQIKGISIEDLAAQMSQNYTVLFEKTPFSLLFP